jgi:ABC-type lipoprotein export system ATPase subunit
MNVLAAVDRPSAGQAKVAGYNLKEMKATERDAYRRNAVGYVWQRAGMNFLPELTVVENLQLPLLGTRIPAREKRSRADELAEAFGLQHCRGHLPFALSGGERRLLAVAVALANRPKVLLADEPTAGLDRAAGAAVLAHLSRTRERDGTTIVFVTHERRAERFADRVLQIRDGRTSTETRMDAGERVIIDRAGRLQLPRYLIESVGLVDLANVRLTDDGILITPIRDKESDA